MSIVPQPASPPHRHTERWKARVSIDHRLSYGVVLVLVAYVLAIVPLYSGIGDAVFFLSLIPLVITGSLLGTWPAVVVALLLSGLNLYLSYTLGGDWQGMWGKAAVFSGLHLLIGAGVGRWRDLNQLLHQELGERKEVETQLKHLAYHDTLTGLPNRLLFRDRVQQGLAHARRDRTGLSLLFLNIDRMKNVNDTLGHEAGDRLLAEISNRIQRCLRNSDTVARFDGDTFAILLPRIHDPQDAMPAAEKVMSALRQTFFMAGQEIHIAAHVGMAVFPQDGEDSDTLFRNADAAMHQAKVTGTRSFQAYHPAINKQALERMVLENGIRKSLDQSELILHYQPIVEIATGNIVATEALLRWRHPELGMVSPSVFIPAAEDTDMIHAIGDWVLRTACSQLHVWHGLGFRDLRMAVNLSPKQLRRADLWRDFVGIAEQVGVSPGQVDLEITESSLLGQESQVMENLEGLRAAGFHLALDDFGTGYSCLAYLKDLPLSCLKVDRSFVQEVNVNAGSASITYAIVAMAKALKLRVIAEGVETQEQCAFLWQLQCDEIQGYLFDKPMMPEGIMAALGNISQRRARISASMSRMPVLN